MSKLTKFFIRRCLIILFILLTPAVFPIRIFASVVINELLPNPSSGHDWIEFYNTDQTDIDISGWKIIDNTSEILTFAEGTKISSSSSYLKVEVANRLNKDGDNITLKDKNNNVVDEKSYNQDPGKNISIGRSPDGSGNWDILTNSTPNSANSSLVPAVTPTDIPKPTSTPKATSVSKPSSTPKPAIKATANTPVVSTNTPVVLLTSNLFDKSTQISSLGSQTDEVLGEFTSEEIMSGGEIGEATKAGSKSNIPILAILLAGGLVCFLAAAVISIRQIKNREIKN